MRNAAIAPNSEKQPIKGCIKNITNNNAEVVTVISKDYGDEVVINNQLFIVTGTNNNHLSFLRQKNAIDNINFKKNQKVIIKNESVDLVLGRIDFINKQPVVITPRNLNLDNLRVLINDQNIFNFSVLSGLWKFQLCI